MGQPRTYFSSHGSNDHQHPHQQHAQTEHDGSDHAENLMPTRNAAMLGTAVTTAWAT